MPATVDVLDSLARIAGEWRWLAIAWHVAAIVAASVLLIRPARRQRAVAKIVTLPLISVSGLAWWSGNPFNGAMFAVLTAALLVDASRIEDRPLQFASAMLVTAGSMLVIFGLVYPHFLPDGSRWSYLYAAPFGLIPCPTLLVMTGVSLIAGVFGSRAWGFTLGVVALAYGVIGVAVLGVVIDAALIAGALLLLAAAAFLLRRGPHRGTMRRRHDQYGAVRLADHILRVRAEEREVERLAAVNAEHDQVGITGERHAEQLPRNTALENRGLDGAVLACVCGNERPQPGQALGLGFGPDSVDVEVRGLRMMAELRWHVDHVQQGQFRVRLLGDLQCQGERVYRRR